MLSREIVEQAANRYPPNEELKDAKVFSEQFREAMRAKGYMETKDLFRVADWVARRAKGYIRRNRREEVVAATRRAFADTDLCRAITTLDNLHGVGIPMGSAILTVWEPKAYTVIARNTWATLKRLGYISSSWTVQDSDSAKPETYRAYLDLCKRLADDFSVSLRTLDRCLWVLNGRTPHEFLGQAVRA